MTALSLQKKKKSLHGQYIVSISVYRLFIFYFIFFVDRLEIKYYIEDVVDIKTPRS